MKNLELHEKLIKILQDYPMMGEALIHANVLNEQRLKVLQNIFFAIRQNQTEQALDRIYEYGSLVKKDDLLARQIFLSILMWEEEREKINQE